MIFVDSNVPMYMVGAPHPNRAGIRQALDQFATRRERLVSDAEVLQEILHRYRAIDRPQDIQPAFDALLSIADDVFAVERADVERAKDILLERWRLAARDAVHVAVMERRGVRRIFSYDRGFDAVPGIERLT